MKKYNIFIYLLIINIFISNVFGQASVPVSDSAAQATLSSIFGVLDTIASNIAKELPIINVNIARNLQGLIENQAGDSFSDIERLNLYFNLVQDSSALLSDLEQNTPDYQKELFDEGQKVGLIKTLNELPNSLKCIPAGRRDSFKYFVMNYLYPYDLSLKGEEIIESIPDCAPTNEDSRTIIKIPYSLSLLNPFNMAYFLGNVSQPGTNPFNFQLNLPSIEIENKSNETFEDFDYQILLLRVESTLSIGRDLEVYRRFKEMGLIMPAFEKCESGDLKPDDLFTDSGQPLCGYRRILIGGEEFKNLTYATKRNIYPFISSMKESQALNTVVENMPNIHLPYNLSHLTLYPTSNISAVPTRTDTATLKDDDDSGLTQEKVENFFKEIKDKSSGPPASTDKPNISGLFAKILDNAIVLNGIKFGDLKEKFCAKVEKDDKPSTGLVGSATCMKDIVKGLGNLTESRIKDLKRRYLTLDRATNLFQASLDKIATTKAKVDSNCPGAIQYLTQQEDNMHKFRSHTEALKGSIRVQLDLLELLMQLVGEFLYKAINFINSVVSFALKIQDSIDKILTTLKQNQKDMLSKIAQKLLSFIPIPNLQTITSALDFLVNNINIILSLMKLPSVLSEIITDLLSSFNNILAQFGTHIDQISKFNNDINLIEQQYYSQIGTLTKMQRELNLYGVKVGFIIDTASNSQFKCRIAKKNDTIAGSPSLPFKNQKKYITYYSPSSQQNRGIFNALVANILSIKKIFEPKILTINLQ